tara:strand:+ start:6953 stop:9994 length:3042 start_codon:yes stop_codon:yes gene_type:complete
MLEKEPELAAKKKFVVNESSFYSVPRTKLTEDLLVMGGKDTGIDFVAGTLFSQEAYENVNDSLYFNAPTKDKLRIVLGKNWDFSSPFYHYDSSPPGPEQFSNSWKAPRLFGTNVDWTSPNEISKNLAPIELNYCEEATEVQAAGSFGLTGAIIKQKVVVSTVVPEDSTTKAGLESKKLMSEWVSYMKTGIISPAGTSYDPVVSAQDQFYDHYHESISPFTPSELENKNPVGKTFFADFKTYYNEIKRSYDTIDFENFSINNSGLQNALPNIYAFLRLLLNKTLAENDLFNLTPIISQLQKYYVEEGVDMKNVYVDLLKEYPLEALVTLYGIIGYKNQNSGAIAKESKIIEKIITTSFKNVDAYSLFSDYHAEYTKFLQEDDRLQLVLSDAKNRTGALERIMTNIVFSPDCFKILNKVDQYKKYFPYYTEIEFTANIFTSLGDTMKQFYLTKFVSEAILNSLLPPKSTSGAERYVDSWINLPFGAKAGMADVSPFVEYSQEAIYKNLSSLEIDHSENFVSTSSKKVLDFAKVLEQWLQQDPVESGLYLTDQQDTDFFGSADLRNYVTHFRNDYSDPVNLNDDDNVIFKVLFGTAFYTQLMSIYNNKRRTYQQIIDGIPAYHEDLFYRIEKERTVTDASGNVTTEIVQNVMIPNTSDLDIVKYVDTQMKYSKSSTSKRRYSYKYNVYAHRIVFGSKYSYQWIDQSVDPPTVITEQYLKLDLSEAQSVDDIINPDFEQSNDLLLYGMSKTLSQDQSEASYSATFEVLIQPDIVILEDKIFSTPEITILDRPPVIPDVNIVPYRAVNNRIKILITGASDRYKAKPVIMLSGDEEEFDLIKKSQLVVDEYGNPLESGEVEFGSDDPVRRFQIFRINKKPVTYSEFELYEEINQEFFEEQILPNTKYYYTFRAIDDHGHFSNPTPVYEVELIDEKGAVKPIIRLVNMDPPKQKTNIKDCQKYIYLRPSRKQLYFSDNPDIDSIFSDATNKKRYKMRITSKGSGKKIDINFSFKKNILSD